MASKYECVVIPEGYAFFATDYQDYYIYRKADGKIFYHFFEEDLYEMSVDDQGYSVVIVYKGDNK
jgi:hypothetical protein